MKVYINGQCHMAINCKNLLLILKLGMKHQGEELYKIYINHDPGMTLTYFTARSTKVAHAFE